jgi:diaminohydroxyphosphoribosylaminopyrimidine deaminase/5-amino-6-(5-phosphoribosylamino)uracil reductase
MDGRLSNSSKDRTFISNEYSHRLVHKWRSEEAAILVGTNTALMDDPDLTVRLWKGKNPIRLVIDVNGRLPDGLRLFNQETMTFVFSSLKEDNKDNLQYHYVDPAQNLMPQVMEALYQSNIQSVLIEGGTFTLQSIINEGLWDEARIITNNHLHIPDGLPAPVLPEVELIHEHHLISDSIRVYRRKGD